MDIIRGGDVIRAACVLVIDKDEVLAEKAAVVLAEAGYDVVTATDAIDGLRKVYEVRPDLIIAGRELPMINGEDACLKIRQASYLPILVLGSEEEAVETLELGIDAFLTKPPSTNELVARVRALLRRKMGPHPPAAKELAA
jgi:DNA-binding response OmpR family regulator